MMWRRIGEWRYSSAILHRVTRWRRVVQFTPLPLYLWGGSPRNWMFMRLGRPQSRSGRYGEEENLLLLLEIEPGVLGRPARSLVDYTNWACMEAEANFLRMVLCYRYVADSCICLCGWTRPRLSLRRRRHHHHHHHSRIHSYSRHVDIWQQIISSKF
jgi:hypothetical protein